MYEQLHLRLLVYMSLNIGIRSPKVEKENYGCSKYYQNKVHKDIPIRKDHNGRLTTVPNFRE
jgi:hypothetical protein